MLAWSTTRSAAHVPGPSFIFESSLIACTDKISGCMKSGCKDLFTSAGLEVISMSCILSKSLFGGVRFSARSDLMRLMSLGQVRSAITMSKRQITVTKAINMELIWAYVNPVAFGYCCCAG
jgi:hypothetical protein